MVSMALKQRIEGWREGLVDTSEALRRSMRGPENHCLIFAGSKIPKILQRFQCARFFQKFTYDMISQPQ